MPFVNKNLYNKIHLFDRLDSMPMKKLVKFAWDNYGIVYNPSEHSNKYDLITDIKYALKDDKPEAKNV